jgi:hypothetical protein
MEVLDNLGNFTACEGITGPSCVCCRWFAALCDEKQPTCTGKHSDWNRHYPKPSITTR